MRRSSAVTLVVVVVSACSSGGSGKATHPRQTASVSCDYGNSGHASATISRTPTTLVMVWHSLPPILHGHRSNAAGVTIGGDLYDIGLIWHDDGTSSGVLWDYSTPGNATSTNVPHRFGHRGGRVTVPLGRMRKLPRTFAWSASTGIADLGNLVSCPAAGQQLRFPLTRSGW